MPKHVKLAKITKQDQDKLKTGIEKYFKLHNYQTYFPAMTFWEDFQNNSYSHQLFTLDSKYQLASLERPSDKKDSNLVFLGYLKKKGSKDIQSQKQEIYFKVNPILEPVQTMMNKYHQPMGVSLPNVFDYMTNKKINNPNNFSYVETLFYYLSSQLVETGKCPAFPYFYGSYIGIMESYQQNITDDYQSIKNCSWFNENKGKLFNLDKLSLEEKLARKIKVLDKVDSLEQKKKDHAVGAVDLNIEDLSLENHQNNSAVKKRFKNDDVSTSTSFKGFELNKKKSSSSNNLELENTIQNNSGDESSDELDFDDESCDESCSSGDESCSGDESGEESNNLDDDLENDLENDLEKITTASDVSSISELCDDIFDEELDDSYYYIKFKDYPVQLIAMESLNQTLDELLKNNELTEVEWLGILFQICFGLAVAQKHFKFTHNDLHSSNIMFKPSKISYLYYFFKGIYYRIPTFGKITKIIDFARAVFTVDGHQFFSDVFKHDGDAEGQYTYPYYPNTVIKHAPNPSFDLCYLAITIKEHFQVESPVYLLLEKWMTDKYGNNLGFHQINFDLYVKIAHNVNNAIPKNQLKDSLFSQFRIRKEDIPKNTYVYYF